MMMDRERWLLLAECRATWGPKAARQLADKLGIVAGGANKQSAGEVNY